ncbi:MAG: protoporphyrinogen oxidase [Acidobacteriota bacterium]|nr:protoporphyrinogen oxidase [Acidobacteriota bacterium]
MKHVVIIGAGISGLAAAYKILERHAELREPIALTLFEAGSRVGGTIQTEERDGFLLERGPDAFITEKPEALDLARRLGLEPHLIQTNENHRRSFVVRNGRLLPIPSGFSLIAPSRLRPFVTSEIFSWQGKARIALDLLLPRGKLNGDADESFAQFVQRRLGREALERMAQPMVGGIYTADPETLSLQATMPRFLEMERRHRSLILALRRSSPKAGEAASGARYSMFLSFDSGMQLLTDTLAERISEPGDHSTEAAIRFNARVDSLTLDPPAPGRRPKWGIQTVTETLSADAVCLALPAFVSAQLLRNIDAQMSSELSEIPYASSATINLAYKREDIPHPLDGFGFVVPFIEKRTVMACTFSSVKFDGRAPDDNALLRAFVGGALQPELLELAEAELVSRVRSDLRDLLGIQRPPLFTEVCRWERSMPQYLLGHIKRLKRIEERLDSLPTLALAGNAYSGLGIPDCIRSGESAAEKLLRNLQNV